MENGFYGKRWKWAYPSIKKTGTIWIVACLHLALTSLHAGLTLNRIGGYDSGVFDDSGTEIVAFDPGANRMFVTNASLDQVDVVDIADPTTPQLLGSITFGDLPNPGGPFGINSVAVSNGIVAVALEGATVNDDGIVAFYAANLSLNPLDAPLATAEAGNLPDMLTFTPDGSKVLVANEGEAEESGETAAPSVNPEGSVTIISISGGADAFSVDQVTQLDFSAFEPGGAQELGASLEAIKERTTAAEPKVRIHPNAGSVSEDLEPEYIAVSPDGTEAYVMLQEANAVAIVDVVSEAITAVEPLGYKDHSLAVNGLDANRNDDTAVIEPQPFYGMYMPDAAAAVEIEDAVYILTANEGDGRDPEDFGALAIGGLGDEADIKDLALDPEAFPNAATLQDGDGIGDTGVSAIDGDIDGDGDLDEIYSQGARSFTIWNPATGNVVYDSGSEFERITAAFFPDHFNASNSNNTIDNRSDNKGPEPEAITVGELNGTTYAFIGLERIGGVMIYDISDPVNARYVNYINTRDFSLAIEAQLDSGPEDLKFIPAEASPNDKPLLLMTSEVSGMVAIFEIEETELLTVPETLLRDRFEDDFTGISTRGVINAGDFENVLNSSIIIVGKPMNVVFRGRSTSINLDGVAKLPDPFIDVVRVGEGVIASNDNYTDAENIELLTGTSLDPATVGMSDTESILVLLNLPPGAYSVRVRSASEGGTGLAIAEAIAVD